jgi:hypothetical protein
LIYYLITLPITIGTLHPGEKGSIKLIFNRLSPPPLIESDGLRWISLKVLEWVQKYRGKGFYDRF